MKKIVLFLSFFVFVCEISAAQVGIAAKSGNDAVLLFGKKYYFHTVKKGETLLIISNIYNISQKEIVFANREIINSIKEGMVLKIPVIDGQNATRDEMNRTKRYTHFTIPKGQTLYDVSKKFNISVEEMLRENPELRSNHIEGKKIKIPIYAPKGLKREDSNFYYHSVESQQTLFSIARQYAMDMKDILRYNPEVKKGLKSGQTLKIPKIKSDTYVLTIGSDGKLIPVISPLFLRDSTVPPCDQFRYDSKIVFQIVLFLPLFLNDNYNIASRDDSEKEKNDEQHFANNSKKFYDFYEGLLFALDDLRKEGLSVDLLVFDTEKDNDKIREILQKPELAKVDLIIGPIYSNNMKIASEFAKEHKINIISPLSQNDELLKDNPFVFQIVPSEETQIEEQCRYFASLPNKSIVVIHNGSKEETDRVEIMRRKLVKSFSSNDSTKEVIFKEINYKTQGFSGVEDAFSVGLDNIIYISSTNEVFVSSLLTSLNKLTKTYSLTVYGSETWEKFENVEFNCYKNLNVHYFSPVFVDFKSRNVYNFVSNYRLFYKTEPSMFSFYGYDISYYFLNALRRYGKNFQFCLSPNDVTPNRVGLQTEFNFRRVEELGGFENFHIFVVKYNDEMSLIREKK